MEYEKLCSDVLDIDKKIRFAAIYNSKIEQIAGGMRRGVENLTPESITKLSVEQSFMRWHTRLEMNEWIGMPKYALAEYDKIKRFTFHINHEKLLLISTELNISNDFLIEKVRKLI
jgi:hypothetical protein